MFSAKMTARYSKIREHKIKMILSHLSDAYPIHELFAVIALGFSNFLLGYTFTNVAYMDDGDGTELESILGSLNVFAAILGPFIFGYVSNRAGRKAAMLLVYLFYLFGGLAMLISEELIGFCTSRILVGIANGGRPILVLFTSEVCHKDRRGQYISFYTILTMVGVLLTYTLQYFISISMVNAVTTTFAFMGIICTYFIPETKYWYMLNNQPDKAEESALWYCPKDSIEKIRHDLSIIVENEQGSTSSFKELISNRLSLKLFSIATALFIFRTFCGREPLGVYPENVFERLDTAYDPRILTVEQPYINLIAGIGCMFLISKFNRRSLLMTSVCGYITIIILQMVCHSSVEFVNDSIPWIVPLLFWMYTAFVSAFLFPLVTVVSCELISKSNQHRNTLLNASWTVNNSIRACFTYLFPTLLNEFDIDVILSIFLIANIFILILTRFCIIETANKELHSCVVDTKEKGIEVYNLERERNSIFPSHVG